MPFRDAYKKIGKEVEERTFVPNKEFTTTHIGSIHNLGLNLIQEKLDKFLKNSCIKE